jgi:hypothetical protein
MARLFLDANVLFSAAYRSDTGLLKLWKLREVVLCSSRYALEEARINLNNEVQRTLLVRLAGKVQLFDAGKHELLEGVSLTHRPRGAKRHHGNYPCSSFPEGLENQRGKNQHRRTIHNVENNQ